MESNFNAKGEEFMKKGDKKCQGSFFKNIFSNKSERADEATEFYKNAATQFKLAKNWDDAGKAYLRCADCAQRTGSGDQAEHLVEAANMIKKVNVADAIQYMDQAIDLYCAENRISYAAKLKKQIGEMYEQDLEYTLACKYYQEAADLFYAENDRTSDYNNMRLKIAELSVNQSDINFIEIIKIYEEVADRYLENKLTEPSAKGLYFKSALLHLANNDTVGCTMAIEKYCDKAPSFTNSRQQKFVSALVNCVDENNLELYSEECFKFNQIIPLDKWQTTVLTKIKETLKSTGSNQEQQGDPDDGIL